MILVCKKIKSLTRFELFFRKEHGVLFQSFSEAQKGRGREEVNQKCYPKSQHVQ